MVRLVLCALVFGLSSAIEQNLGHTLNHCCDADSRTLVASQRPSSAIAAASGICRLFSSLSKRIDKTRYILTVANRTPG